jgi:hypothetical protein
MPTGGTDVKVCADSFLGVGCFCLTTVYLKKWFSLSVIKSMLCYFAWKLCCVFSNVFHYMMFFSEDCRAVEQLLCRHTYDTVFIAKLNLMLGLIEHNLDLIQLGNHANIAPGDSKLQ